MAATSLTAWLECSANCAPAQSAHAFLRNLYLTVSDFTSPVIVGLGGELFQGGVRRGTEELILQATDNANLTGMTVRANDVLIADRLTNCSGLSPAGNGPASSLHPCQTTAGWTVPINTELLPNGDNEIEACVYDLAFDKRARNVTCERRTIHVDNTCPSSGGTEATAIDARLQSGTGTPSSSIRTRSDRGSVVRGTLSGPGSMAGATVCLYEQVDLPGDGRELVDTGRVKEDGSFSLDVAPGPSRLFDVVYRFNNRTAEKERLYLDSVVVPTLKLVGKSRLRNGESVRFSGMLPGPNADGRGISMQARVGRKWRTFKQVRANPRGAFSALYTFTQTVGIAGYTFRARVKRQGNYPYSAGSSRQRKVIVRG